MTLEEAITFAHYAQKMTDINDVKEFYKMAEAALREQKAKGVEIEAVRPPQSWRYVEEV